MIRHASIALLLLAAPVAAQTAEDYYHDAARLYIAENNAEAERAALDGLALDPTDPKLQALLDKIRERDEQQQSGEGEQDEQDETDDQQQGEGEQEDQDASGQPQPGDEGQPDDSQTEPGEQQSQEQPQDPSDEPLQDEREGDTGSEGEQPPDAPQGGGGEATPFDVKPGTMSRAEAERLLRALQADELELLRDVQRRRTRPRYVEKDW